MAEYATLGTTTTRQPWIHGNHVHTGQFCTSRFTSNDNNQCKCRKKCVLYVAGWGGGEACRLSGRRPCLHPVTNLQLMWAWNMVMFTCNRDPLFKTSLHITTSGQRVQRVPLIHTWPCQATEREAKSWSVVASLERDIFPTKIQLAPRVMNSKWKNFINWILVQMPQCYCKCQPLVYMKMLQNITSTEPHSQTLNMGQV